MSSASAGLPDRPDVRILLGDIKDNPGEDRLRLILADWLEENGAGPVDQARAEVIRVGVAQARLPANAPERFELNLRARALQHQWMNAWLGPLGAFFGAGTTVACVRGLLSVTLPASRCRSQTLSALAESEAWQWVEEVSITSARDDEVVQLRNCPLLRSIGALAFVGNQIQRTGARVLAEMPWLSRLFHLDLTLNPIGDAGLQALLASPRLEHLTSLELGNCQLTAAAGPTLAEWPGFARLERLIVWGNRLGNSGIAALSAAAAPRLAVLDVRGNTVGDPGGSALARARSWPALRELYLADNQLGPLTAEALAIAPGFATLTSLTLWGNPISAGSAARLRERFGRRVHLPGERGGGVS